MKATSKLFLNRLIEKYPSLSACEASIFYACEILIDCYKRNGKALICGNGGSAADAGHIVGELMKGFLLKREIPNADISAIRAAYPNDAELLSKRLQGSLPAIALTEHAALNTAYANDVDAEMIFAQQVYGYGAEGDVLVAITTSGNARNVINAAKVARSFGLKVIGLTGESGGLLNACCDACVRVPSSSTPEIQELHLPVYHALCAAVEEEFFGG